MSQAAMFFRVFDIAFFAPGALLAVMFWRTGFLEAAGINESMVTKFGDWAAIGLALVLAYVLGLICHGWQRLTTEWVWRCLPKSEATGPTWYDEMPKSKCQELALYSWYLRATVWNMAVAIVISLGLTKLSSRPDFSKQSDLRWMAILSLIPLCFLGWDFQRATHLQAARGVPDPVAKTPLRTATTFPHILSTRKWRSR